MRSIIGCLSLVLMHAEQQADPQARLLLDCITRCLWGSEAQALNAAQLLGSVLQELTDDNGNLWQPVQQVKTELHGSSAAGVCRSACSCGMSGGWSHAVAGTDTQLQQKVLAHNRCVCLIPCVVSLLAVDDR